MVSDKRAIQICFISTIDSQQLHRAAQKVTILSIQLQYSLALHIIKLIGRVELKILYFCLNSPITLSTCMRTRDSCRALSISHLLSCFLPFVKGWKFNFSTIKASSFVNVETSISQYNIPRKKFFQYS